MKNINGKKNKLKKKIIVFIVLAMFLLFSSSSLVLINRKYTLIETSFKKVSSIINSYIVNHLYSNKGFKSTIVNSRIKYLEQENNSLKRSLSLKESNTNYVVASVTNHTSKYFFDRIDIDSGKNKKIKKDYAVINDKGLVGFVSKTSKNTSEVKLLTSINENNMLSITINCNNKNISGALKEYDPIKKLFKITDIIDKTESLKDSNVYLSNYNFLYNGIYVGKIVDVEKDNYGLSKIAWVKSDVDFDDLLHVIVVVK